MLNLIYDVVDNPIWCRCARAHAADFLVLKPLHFELVFVLNQIAVITMLFANRKKLLRVGRIFAAHDNHNIDLATKLARRFLVVRSRIANRVEHAHLDTAAHQEIGDF